MMTRSTVFCNHYRAMSEHKTCNAGVAYETFKGMAWDARACFGKPGEPPKPGCDLCEMPSAEQLAAEEAKFADRFERIGKARAAIVAACGGPWKKGMQGSQGQIDCPACGGDKTLSYTRAGYNGHVHARCSTSGCVSWME